VTAVRLRLLVLLSLSCAPALADDPPTIDYQPASCTVPDQAMSICAAITDDVQVAKATVYFRAEKQQYYSFVEMAFGGIDYCATLPAVRGNKTAAIEYYVQAVDNQYQPARTSTYRMVVQTNGVCEFPPIEKNAARAAAIRVFATHKKQGGKLDGAFDPKGVTFVPVASN
jgi:hypothetical protein